MIDPGVEQDLADMHRRFHFGASGPWIRDVALVLSELTDGQLGCLVSDRDSHLTVFPSGPALMPAVGVCPGDFCRSYRESREREGLGPDPDHQPFEDELWLVFEAARRGWCVYPHPFLVPEPPAREWMR